MKMLKVVLGSNLSIKTYRKQLLKWLQRRSYVKTDIFHGKFYYFLPVAQYPNVLQHFRILQKCSLENTI